jgi:hypothetical protein
MKTCGGMELYVAPPLLPSELDGGGSASRPCRYWIGGSGRCGEEKNLALLGNRTQVVHPLARRYTD